MNKCSEKDERMEDDMGSHEASTHDSMQIALHAFIIFIRVGCSHF